MFSVWTENEEQQIRTKQRSRIYLAEVDNWSDNTCRGRWQRVSEAKMTTARGWLEGKKKKERKKKKPKGKFKTTSGNGQQEKQNDNINK